MGMRGLGRISVRRMLVRGVQILEVDSEGLRGLTNVETFNGRMRGLGRISVRSMRACGVGEIVFWCMEILEEDSRRIRGVDKFEII